MKRSSVSCSCLSLLPFRLAIAAHAPVYDVHHLSQPARTFLSPKSVSVALTVGEQQKGKRVPAGIDPGPRPPTSRGGGIQLLGWSHRTYPTTPECIEVSSVPRLTRTPRKRPASWALHELNLLDTPDRCIIIFSCISIMWFIFWWDLQSERMQNEVTFLCAPFKLLDESPIELDMK